MHGTGGKGAAGGGSKSSGSVTSGGGSVEGLMTHPAISAMHSAILSSYQVGAW